MDAWYLCTNEKRTRRGRGGGFVCLSVLPYILSCVLSSCMYILLKKHKVVISFFFFLVIVLCYAMAYAKSLPKKLE